MKHRALEEEPCQGVSAEAIAHAAFDPLIELLAALNEFGKVRAIP